MRRLDAASASALVVKIGQFRQYIRVCVEGNMKRLSAAEAKNAFGHLIDLARHEPVLIEKHNRPVVVVISIEEYDRMRGKNSAKS